MERPCLCWAELVKAVEDDGFWILPFCKNMDSGDNEHCALQNLAGSVSQRANFHPPEKHFRDFLSLW
ncbi:hypothetical protein GRJ2_000900400 [Grus japonensis]|uniref:Uncharacterized protein n=1 Tax=Grus japonensis TaxID=30415 RepID=A0ABC9WGI6_GRUJA